MSKVLIVEDDQFIREMYAFILTKDGHDVTEAGDGAIGLSEAQKGGFDVILLDLMMPQVDGLGFLQGLKDKPPKTKNGPIVVMSNLAYGEANCGEVTPQRHPRAPSGIQVRRRGLPSQAG